jgi:hypothetical protein
MRSAHLLHAALCCMFLGQCISTIRQGRVQTPARQAVAQFDTHACTHACMQVLHVLLGHCRHVLSPVVGWELQAGAVTDRYQELAVLVRFS